MTGMLASVRNLEEAKMVYQGGADIIDIKEPNEGALGAVPLSQIHHVVDDLWEKCVVSATIGDLPADSNQINDKVCLLYTSPSPRDATLSRMPSSA